MSTGRSQRALPHYAGCVGFVLVLAGCGAQSQVPSASSIATASASVVPTASIGPSSEPDIAAPSIEVGDYLEVTGNGLAVRSGPGTDHPLVSEFLLGRTEPLETILLRAEVRLPAGHVVQANLGPLIVDDLVWFAVYNVPQAGQADDETPIWRTVAPVPYSEIDFELTWIAVAEAGVTFVRVTERPACSPCFEAPPPTAVAGGSGQGRVGPWINSAPPWIIYAAAARRANEVCDFRLATPAGELMREELGVDYLSGYIPGVSPAPDAAPDAEVWLDVGGDCEWALRINVT
jgi:hypothetical protein